MKYIVYEFIPVSLVQFSSKYNRYEIKSDEELKEFLFKHQNNLKHIEIFNKSDKCEINFEIHINH